MRLFRWQRVPVSLASFFLVGLAIRLLAMAGLDPYPMRQWFSPFIEFFLSQPSIDPWSAFVHSGAINSFPYGIVMLGALTPLSALAYLFSPTTSGVTYGLFATMLFADIACFYLLRRLLPKKDGLLLLFWWLSPLVLATNYWIGQLDVIPVCLLLCCFVSVKEKRYRLSGVLMSMALSAKLSMALALPFLLLYFFRNKRMLPYAGAFLTGFVPSAIVLLGGPLLSQGFHGMALGTSELTRLFDLRLQMGAVSLYLAPVLYTLVVYAAWRIAFLSFELLTAFTAMAMLTIVLTTPTPPGWQLWAWPFLLMLLVRTCGTQSWLGYAYALCAAASQVLFWPPPFQAKAFLPIPQGHLYALFLSLQFCMGVMLLVGILRNGIRANQMFRLGLRPISIAIAGDSGTGKDTLAEGLIDILGASNTVHISGDDYHHWDRKNSAWRMVTHLNPRANDLKRLFSDVNAILDGKQVVRRHYQHGSGHFSQPFAEEPSHFFIASGLHTLISRAACARFDVRVFLELDDTLRILFKCRRDAQKRGHSLDGVKASIEKRKPDGVRYIDPQRKFADIVFIRRAVHKDYFDIDSTATPPCVIEIHLKNSLYHEDLARQLICLCGLRVDTDFTQSMEECILTVDGDILGEDMAHIASRAFPEFEELLAVNPQWRDGVYGLMQLVILYHMHQELKSKR